MKISSISKLLGLSFLLLLFGCTVLLIGAYDEVTDQGFQKIQTSISSLLVKIKNNINDPAEVNYSKFKPAYEDIEGQIESLKIRCNSLPKYKLVVVHANGLDSTFKALESFHKLGLMQSDTASLRIIKKTFDIEFNAIIQLQNGLKREKNVKQSK
ncbi:MAG TPA: hypothetical protein VHP12_07420 [Chitinophagaceae bacterium]|nr:hypothetical protein [Chitinophagaceae bacterium]